MNTIGNLGTVGRSIYTAFLEEDRAAGKWRCLFGGEHESCPKASKSFERVERAIEHIRRHLGHRPYPCTDTCPKSGASGAACGQRFFASQYLQDHIRRPATRARRAQSQSIRQ
ncbi:hypothetical protein FRB91_006651 [Serendipita sp. 411]|nr:hypothetical protein FRB91_006651 [Serendipita sp. 411]